MFMEHFEGTLQTILIFAVLLSTILISWVVIRWAKGPSAKNRDLPKLKFRQFQALYYLNPESWTLGELTATYEGVGEFRFSYLGEIRYGFFYRESAEILGKVSCDNVKNTEQSMKRNQ